MEERYNKTVLQKKEWFTLIELLVVIFIIGVITLSATNINFHSLNDKQKLDIFVNKVTAHFEEIRNNSLLWKAVGTNIEIPKEWKIEISRNWSGSIRTYYNTWVWIEHNKVKFEKLYEIKTIQCLSLDGTFTHNITWTWIIQIKWSNLNLSWECSDPRLKKIKTIIQYKNLFEKTFEINTINWLVETKK
jgi:prepilin-type N-terminal cleavage/methylation domain-containing protein